MAREGELDPASGQRAAFPPIDLSDDEDSLRASAYLREVSRQANTLALQRLTEPKSSMPSPVLRRETTNDSLSYAEYELCLSEVVKATYKLFGGLKVEHSEEREQNDKIVNIYKTAYAQFSLLKPQHPSECTSLATWKSWMTSHEPIPVNHEDTFRLFKYLVRWCSAKPPKLLFVWAWSLLLRTPDLLIADEISTLRDVSRSLQNHRNEEPLASAFIYIVGTVFRQSDLLLDLEK